MRRAVLVGCFVAACGARSELGAPVTHDDLDGSALDGDVDASDATPPSPCHVTGPTLLASGGKEIQFIALDATDVYWTDFALGTVNAVSKGGGPSRVIAPARANPSGVVVTSGKVFWTEFTGDVVASADTSGENVTTLATRQDGAFQITALGDDLYWTTLRGCAVARLKPGGKSEVLAIAKQPFEAIVSTSSLVFWVSLQQKAVERFDPSTNSSAAFDVESALPSALATDGHNLYFGVTSPSAVSIGAVSVNGGDAHTVYESECSFDGGTAGGCLAALATNGKSIYFTAAAPDGALQKIPVAGGDAVTIADHQSRPFSVAVDDACVYWSNLGDGTIWAAPVTP